MTHDYGVDISSPGNRWIKFARSLHRRRNRYRERAILVEGIRPVSEALSSGVDVHAILLSGDFQLDSVAKGVIDKASSAAVPVLRAAPGVFTLATDTETPQGILALCAMPDYDTALPAIANPFVLIVDQVRDPGNLGTLLRSALGSGVSAVLIGPDSVDPYSPKVLRAGAGSHFRLQVRFLDWSDPPGVLEGCTVYVTEAGAELEYDRVDWTRPAAIVIGNETKGVSEPAIARADGRVGIPLANSLESLNAGIAGSVILFEAWRQRRNA